MAEFSVKANAVRTTVDAEEELKRELENIQQSIRKISGSLAIKTTAAPGLKRRLGRVAGRVEDHRESMGSMKNALEEAMGLYEKTEQGICGNTGGGIKAQAKTETASSSFWDDLVDFWGKIVGEIGAIVGGIISSITTAWSKLAAFFEGAIGNGDVTDEQPTAGWATEGVTTGGAAGGTAGATDGDALPVGTGNFVQRTTAPTIDNPDDRVYYFDDNPYPSGGNVPINNCTKYAFGRAYELLGYKPNRTPPGQGNANLWYSNFNPEYERSTDISKPRVGAIICWSGGDYGHVAVVEAINGDQITYSDSSWPYTDKYGNKKPGWTFMTHTVSINDLSTQMGATFQGYIYLPGIGNS